MHLPHAHGLAAGLVVSFVLASLSGSAAAQILRKTITYTRFVSGPDNVKQVLFTYDPASGTTGFSNYVAVATTPGADGILFAPDGDLIIGGQADAVHKIVIANGNFTTVTAGGIRAFHVMLDPSGDKVWTAGIPGGLADVPLNPFRNGTAHPVSGGDTFITHIAFAKGQAFYTTSFPSGLGNFGTIDLNTFTTTQLQALVPWAHGMTLDCYTGHLMVWANSHVAQIDPVSHAIVSQLDVSPLNLQLDQGTADGLGRLYIASNTGHMLFVDLTISRTIGTPDFVDAPFLDTFIDDIAPDCGLGAPPTAPHTLGFWKNHDDKWQLDGMTLGCAFYSKAQCLTLFHTPVRGDASINLAHQLIATKLNIASSGLDWPRILPLVQQADALLCTLGGRLPRTVQSRTANGLLMVALAAQLDDFNNGRLRPAQGGRRR